MEKVQYHFKIDLIRKNETAQDEFRFNEEWKTNFYHPVDLSE